MKTKNESFKRPSKTQLIWYSSLVITIILSVPRFLLMISEIQPQRNVLQEPVEWSAPFAFRITFNLLFCLLFFTLNLQDKRVNLPGLKKFDFNKLSHRLAVSFIAFVIADFIIVSLHVFLFGPYVLQHVFIKAYTLVHLLIFSIILIISQLYLLLFKNQQLKLTNESLEKENAESRFEVLKNQVNPHFLFNSFNTLRGVIQAKPTVAIAFVNNMSDVFRYTLRSTKENVVRLSEEVHFTNAYLDIIKERFGTKINIAVNIDEDSYRYFIPPLALQILAENAIKHNIISEQKPLNLRIDSVTGSPRIIVSNQLQVRQEKDASMGMGLYNLNERYKYVSGKQISVMKRPDEFIVIAPLLTYESPDR